VARVSESAVVSFSDDPTGYSNHREREYLHGSTPSPLLVPYLLIRRLDQEYGQGTQSCEAEKIAKGVLVSCMDFVFRITRRFTFTFVYSRFRYCKFSVEPHLYHGHTLFSCVYDSLILQPTVMGPLSNSPYFPHPRNYLVNTSSDRWFFVSAHECSNTMCCDGESVVPMGEERR
jgi:hypothetical protein